MDATVKAIWIDALRSGEYTQGAGGLTTIDPEDDKERDCCLGVLCKVAVANGLNIDVEHDEDSEVVRYDDSVAYPPDSVVEWAGLPAHDPYLGDNEASVWNDVEGIDFNGIADLIETHL